MQATLSEVYSPREIARAAGVPEQDVIAVLRWSDGFVPHADAVRLGRVLARRRVEPAHPAPIFSLFDAAAVPGPAGSRRLPFAISSTLHAAAAAVALATSVSLAPAAATTGAAVDEPAHLVFLVSPGPGGGGGGGGQLKRTPPPRAERAGRSRVSSPLPIRRPPPAVEPAAAAPEAVPPPLGAEALPALVAPIVAAPADARDRAGVLDAARSESESRGPGSRGGVGSGTGSGIGEGQGAGVGAGSDGGTGGGPFRAGAGIEPPRLLHEVKADYTDDARRRGIEGEVVLEIVVRRDGSVGDVRLVERLDRGLDERAVRAVRAWRFAPATRHGSPVDVLVEVAVEFKLR